MIKSLGTGRFLMPSFTKQDKEYEVNLQIQNCTCPAFWFSKDKPDCKHLRLIKCILKQGLFEAIDYGVRDIADIINEGRAWIGTQRRGEARFINTTMHTKTRGETYES